MLCVSSHFWTVPRSIFNEFSANFQQKLGILRDFFCYPKHGFLSGMEKTISRLLTVPCRWCFWKRVDAETGLLSICKNISVSLNNLEKQNSCFFLLFGKGCQSKKWPPRVFNQTVPSIHTSHYHVWGGWWSTSVFEVKRPKPFHHNVTMTAKSEALFLTRKTR